MVFPKTSENTNSSCKALDSHKELNVAPKHELMGLGSAIINSYFKTPPSTDANINIDIFICKDVKTMIFHNNDLSKTSIRKGLLLTHDNFI